MTSARARRRTACLALLTALVGALLVSVPAASAQSTPPPSPSPSPAADPEPVRVGNADDGRTVHLVPGQELVVELVAPQGEQWQGPRSSGPLYLVEYRETATRTTARLEALRNEPEPVVLEARTDRACFHSGQPCAQGFSTWSLQVVVDPGPAAAPPDYPCMATSRPPHPAPGTVQVTEHDNGRRFTVQKGNEVQVFLGDCYDPHAVPSADGPLFRENATYVANGLNTSTFRALATGTSTITAPKDPACFHTEPSCARPAVVFSVEIEVVDGPAESCNVPTVVELDRSTITATGEVGLTVRTPPGATVDLFAYTQPSTEYRLVRSALVPDTGSVRFSLRPPRNTRLYAQRHGCAAGAPVVLNVATALTLEVTRTAPRTYVFSGDSLPARPGGLVVSLYRVTADGREVLTAQTRADDATGQWRLTRRFSGTGRFGFLVRTGQDLQNAPGRSNVRATLVH